MSVHQSDTMEKPDAGLQRAVAERAMDAQPWYKQRHLLHLNFIISSLVMYSSANGYDGSLMNGTSLLKSSE